MIKKILITLSLAFFASSCSSVAKEEMEKTLKANSASSRINSSSQNNEDAFKDF